MDVPRPPKRVIAWELRLIGWIPLPPFLAGAVVAAGIGAVFVVIRALSGEPQCAESAMAPADDLATGLITAALIGYTMGAGRYLNAAILGDIHESAGQSREVVSRSDDIDVFGSALPQLRRSRVAGLVGAVVGPGMIWLVGTPIHGGQLGNAELVAWLVMVPLLFFLLARAAFNTALGASDRAETGLRPRPPEVDLLDLRPTYARGRIGLRLALVWVVGSTISSLYVLDPQVATSTALFVVAGVAVAIAALLWPARRLRGAIREAKHRELARIREELHRARDEVVSGRAAEGGRLADLLAYRRYVEELRDWPFDNSTVARFLLYLLIPLGSWLGGALVERFVSNLLD